MTKYIRLEEVKISINDDESLLKNKIIKILWIKKDDLLEYKIVKKAIDSRNKRDILFGYSLDVTIKNWDSFLDNIDKLPSFLKTNIKRHRIKLVDNYVYEIKKVNKKPINSPVIIWTWPAWLFAGLVMAEAWLNPIIIERWKDVDSRIKDIDTFSETWKLDLNSNIQFWEGWAWTFSDWKLYTLINDPRSKYVFEELIKAWAPDTIAYDAKPHVWTDKLRILVKELRKKIISLWGMIRFETTMTDIEVENSKLKYIVLNGNEKLETQDLILAVWHSARDTVTMLYERWIEMVAKPFAVWVRIEHSAEMINKSQYWDSCTSPKLWTANYKLVNHSDEARTIYSFCMCPGWFVVPASSEENRLCLNWMSEYAQDSGTSNSALLVPIKPEDFPSDHPLAWIDFQRDLEERAFKLWWNNYFAPAQLVWDFLAKRPSTKLWKLESTYKPWIKLTSIDECLPEFITKALRLSIPELDRKIKWFASNDAILTAVEARSSAVVRFKRDPETLEWNIEHVYPCWEWAWYAWWITSSAIDWLKVGESIIKKYL